MQKTAFTYVAPNKIPGSDLNNLGIFQYTTMDYSYCIGIINLPKRVGDDANAFAGIILCIPGWNGLQIAINYLAAYICIRSYYAGSWSDWKYLHQ